MAFVEMADKGCMQSATNWDSYGPDKTFRGNYVTTTYTLITTQNPGWQSWGEAHRGSQAIGEAATAATIAW